ncbi:MAG TPA: hypothetical protein VFU78_11585 [Thermomicrobiales bacterium]|nr:hypothetical protein [Thermomicrobiales bacterium]
MARKLMAQQATGASILLTEMPAANEAVLQETMKHNPDLLPIDEFGMAGPLLVVGRETTLQSGYVDLLCLARSGELLIIEFKTGPQNPDFRHALAQLLDYGSDLWRLSYDEFENTVATRYFAGPHCHDLQFQGQTSLEAAARLRWPDLTDEEADLLCERLIQQLATGAFQYIVVAQRFTSVMVRTIEYLNTSMNAARFYAVELVYFAADGLTAFESRTVLQPTELTKAAKQPATLNQAQFLEQFTPDTYRHVAQDLLTFCTGLGLTLEGTSNRSIRVLTPDRSKLLSIGWLVPPGISGWYGVMDLTLGYDPASAAMTPSVSSALDAYLASVAALPGAQPAKTGKLRAYRLPPQSVTVQLPQIQEILARLVNQVGELG